MEGLAGVLVVVGPDRPRDRRCTVFRAHDISGRHDPSIGPELDLSKFSGGARPDSCMGQPDRWPGGRMAKGGGWLVLRLLIAVGVGRVVGRGFRTNRYAEEQGETQGQGRCDGSDHENDVKRFP